VLQPSPTLLDAVVVAVGTRRQDRTLAESPVPVDVISGDLADNTGMTTTPEQLQRLVPSVNTPHVPIGDNGYRPVTLRGLAPDQVLVLVNGKRLHPAAAILAGPAVMGSAFADLNAIPTSAIDHIEILRDGATAQYGSDAIGGVVNIVLKSGWRRDFQTTIGEADSHEGGRTFHDGRLLDATTSLGFATDNGAFLTFSGEMRQRDPINRAYPDARTQYFAGDPRNGAAPQISSFEGDAALHDAVSFLSAALPLAHNSEAYLFGGVAARNDLMFDSQFRRPNDVRTVLALYPNGFRPDILNGTLDVSSVAGVRGTTDGWRWDLSSGWGNNRVAYTVRNSNNPSLGALSPTNFYAGRVAAQQWTNNVDVARDLSVGGTPLTLSGGLEYRTDFYQIRAGDTASWRDGGALVPSGPLAGSRAPVGAEGLFGFRPADEVSTSRSNQAAYVEAESRPTQRLLVQAAGRAEHYTDFGSTSNGKLATRFEVAWGFALRGSISTGFRAPALTQEYLSRTGHDLVPVNGVPQWKIVRTFPVNSPEAQAWGAQPLRPEKSVNRSAGVTFDHPGLPLITADYFDFTVRDRIELGADVLNAAALALLTQDGFGGIDGGTFFTNATDIRSRGIDVVASHAIRFGSAQQLEVVGAYNETRSRITRVAPPSPQLAAILGPGLSPGAIDRGIPRETITLAVNYSLHQWGFSADTRRSGPTALTNAGSIVQAVSSRWVTDLRASRQFRRMRVAVNVANLFDAYPNEWDAFKLGAAAPPGATYGGSFRYPGVGTFGTDGRMVSLQFSYR
jgi:iron complex outermembrane receptor protein